MTKEERKIYNKEYNLKNKDKIKLYDILNKEKRKIYNKKYQSVNKDKQKEYLEKHVNKDKEKKKKYHREYIKNRCKIDPLYKLKKLIRENISRSIKRNNFNKISNTQNILGCSFKKFQLYLESKFEFWMSWENHGKYNGEFNYGWDIDHIIPISSAKTEEELIKLNHFSNLQPLCSKINRDIKRDNIYTRPEKVGLREDRI
jgi:hypothetical protein